LRIRWRPYRLEAELEDQVGYPLVPVGAVGVLPICMDLGAREAFLDDRRAFIWVHPRMLVQAAGPGASAGRLGGRHAG
jgi:hypothetical protein